MSGRTWVCADHHFGHRNIITFLNNEGERTRPFESAEEHDEELIRRHNSVVEDRDRVYLLGDVAIPRRGIVNLGRLRGRLVLVKGNHDIFNLDDYRPFVDDVRAAVVQKDSDGHKVILTHIPIHTASLGRWGTNIHGHLHQNRVMQMDGDVETTKPDTRYKCVSLEHTDFYPIEVHQALRL